MTIGPLLPRCHFLEPTRRDTLDQVRLSPSFVKHSAPHVLPFSNFQVLSDRAVIRASAGGQKISIGESDLSEAVVAGIITLEQSDKLWRFLSNEVCVFVSTSCKSKEG